MLHHSSSISNFKRFCLKFLLPLLLLLTAGGYAFQYVFEKAIILHPGINGAYKVNRIINEFHPDEVAMFGSSRMVEGLIPDLLGPNHFNYGLNGTKDDVVQFFLNEEVKKHKSTPVIINLDLNGLNYSTGDISNYLYNLNYQPVKQLIGKQDKLIYHIPFIKYFGFYQYYLKDLLYSKIALTKYTNNGALIEKNSYTPQQFAQVVQQRKNTVSKTNIDTNLFNNLTAIISAHPNRNFFFVIAPYHPAWFYTYKDGPTENKFLNALQAYKNVKVLNFSKAAFPDSLFFDTEHLNYKGAVMFSKALRDTLSKL